MKSLKSALSKSERLSHRRSFSCRQSSLSDKSYLLLVRDLVSSYDNACPEDLMEIS